MDNIFFSCICMHYLYSKIFVNEHFVIISTKLLQFFFLQKNKSFAILIQCLLFGFVIISKLCLGKRWWNILLFVPLILILPKIKCLHVTTKGLLTITDVSYDLHWPSDMNSSDSVCVFLYLTLKLSSNLSSRSFLKNYACLRATFFFCSNRLYVEVGCDEKTE